MKNLAIYAEIWSGAGGDGTRGSTCGSKGTAFCHRHHQPIQRTSAPQTKAPQTRALYLHSLAVDLIYYLKSSR